MAWGKKEADKQIDGAVKALIRAADGSANKAEWREYAGAAIALSKAKKFKFDSDDRGDVIISALSLPLLEKKMMSAKMTTADRKLQELLSSVYHDQAVHEDEIPEDDYDGD
jgi:hypothetical protein